MGLSDSTLFSQKRVLCDWVKYIAALLVVNGHIFMFSNPESAITPFMNLGACCVSIFFFFSGYGLMTSPKQKGDAYLNGFFKRRILKVMLPLLTAYVITLPIYALLKDSINWLTVLKTLTWGGPYLRYSWFVTEIVVLYGAFYIVMKTKCGIASKRNILTLLVLCMMALLIIAGQPKWYVISLPGFIIGIWFQAYEDKISRILSEYTILIISVVIWLFTWQWQLVGHNILTAYKWEYISYYICNIAFVAMVVGLICKLRITPPHLRILRSSYEVYLMQNSAFIILSAFSMPFIGYWISAICSSISIGYFVHNLNTRLYRI